MVFLLGRRYYHLDPIARACVEAGSCIDRILRRFQVFWKAGVFRGDQRRKDAYTLVSV